MTLLFLYGPPAAGKLTVAREVERLTGFRVFHNHLTIDLAREIFAQRDAAFGELVERLRLDCVEAAAKANVSTIFTFVYGAGSDDAFVASVVEAVERHGGRVAFVQLLPSRERLRERVEATSRLSTSKLKAWERLEPLLDEHDLETPLPNSLSIDNSDLPPDKAAAQIVDHLRLVS